MKNYLLFSLIAIGSCMIIFLSSCSDDIEDDPIDDIPITDEIRAYTGTQSPGDVWEFDLNFTTMTWTGNWDNGTEANPSDDVIMGGSFNELPSTYLKMIVTSASPSHSSYPTDGSGFFYAAEIPNMSIFALPAGSLSGSLINGIDRSDCTDIVGTYNFARIPSGAGYDARIEQAYGTIEISGTSSDISLSGWQKSLDCIPTGGLCSVDNVYNIPGSGSCSDGTVDLMDGTTLIGTLQMTPSNTFMIDFGAGNGGVYGGLQSPINISNIAGKKLIGFFDVPETGEQRATTITFDADGMGTGILFLDLETNTIDMNNLVTVQLDSSDNGLFIGHFENQSGVTSYIAGAIVLNGENIVMALISFQDNDPPITNPALSIVLGYVP